MGAEMSSSYDVVVVGAGNAALCAALSARESGVSVLVLECAPETERGGNSRFTAGAMRVAYNGVDDRARVTQYRTSPELAELLVRHSFETMMWMRTKGVRFQPIYGRQAFNVGG